MTIEKLLLVLKQAIQEFFNIFDTCVIHINSDYSISLSEMVIAGVMALVIIRIICIFSFRN